MQLESAESLSSPAATEADIVNAFFDDKGRGEFLILSQSEQVYIQIGGTGDGPFDLEYREVDSEHHFRCTRGVTKREAQTAFLKYLTKDAAWKDPFPWEKLETKPWWKFW